MEIVSGAEALGSDDKDDVVREMASN